MPATCERRTIDGHGLRLAADQWYPDRGVDRRGVAVLLHGGGQTRHAWGQTASTLAGDGWVTLTVDARGHGDSEWAGAGGYTMDAYIADLAAVVASLEDRPVLVGASMGGMTALVGQGERGDLARALVLVDITPTVERAGTRRILEFMTGRPDGFGSLEEAADAVAAYNPHRKRPPSLDGLRKNLRRRDGRWYWHWDPAFVAGQVDEPTRAVSTTRLRAAASRITVPTLLVRGALSDVVSPRAAHELLALVPGARMVEVDGAGHMVAGDDNDTFSRDVLAFLRELPPAP